jgi:hypothetical protein
VATAAIEVYEAVLKQGFTQDNLEVQYVQDDALLQLLERNPAATVFGNEARTTVHTGRGGGYTPVPENGSSELNTASAQQTNVATWKYKRHWNPVKLDTMVIKQTEGNARATAEAAKTEVEGNLADTRKQLTRQLFTDGTARIAPTIKEEAENKKIKFATTGGIGFQAVRNGWLSVGQEIDVGTKTEEAVVASKKAIVAIGDTEAEPYVELSEKFKTTTEDYVSIANARSGETSYETNGLRLLADESETLGGIKPSEESGWKGTVINAEGATITREKVIELRRKIRQKSYAPDYAFTSLKQVEQLENNVYPQVRFTGVEGQNTGDGESIKIGQLSVQGHHDCPDEDLFMCKLANLFLLKKGNPEWVTQGIGGNSMFVWKPNSTYVESAIEWLVEFGTNRRNTIGRLKELG